MAIEEIVIPQLGESITEGSIGSWLKNVGDAVAADEPIVEVETDKVAMEVPSPVAGVLVEQVVAEGDTVEIGALIAKVDTEGKAAAAPAAAAPAAAPAASAPAPAPAAAPAAAPAPFASASSSNLMPMSPAVRRLVEDYNLDPASITGTGKDGRLTKGDVLKAIESGTARTLSATATVVAADTGPREERVKMTRLRKVIATRLKEAQNTAAMLTTYNEVDMTAVMEARAKYKDLFAKKHNIKLGFMSFFTQACCLALKEIPAVNAFIDGDEIVYHNYANVGVAVSSPNGLVVPVLKDAQDMSFAETELAIANYGRKARDGKLTMDDMTGGTFTISNGGIFGSLMSSPILNAPQSAILGMHKIQDRPMAIGGNVVIRPMMYLALSYDHRIIDGREAVTFLVRVKEALEDPTRLLLDM
ncbi:dihydrolipoyllysine-residue succinyltransferase component of 2-oxoglutarate dehydrogenase complex [Kordiimonas sediminis]|uniref:Dihydrolipoyllysine-residue succinyltransferase component of 2-oxoglutarate dehydrogenase complex n=1 Tax=Kordiimonas sediminis TaxID=1735581 RepID=A0A919ARD3_9PROT|nr:2-oxoglutarate dehydrogenase complex dihydrolipoyllysine-residue succinyltransferase [Kordiimonas sediminis]GHF19676.1 dihydrolipoyllysine-residue succinyltransferase component of 2-oxoglutarate dehydrogenase complex [Kordiimonas sediminis]